MTADFETSTEAWGVDEARVWLWDICYDIGVHKNGTTLDSFMDNILKAPNKSLYAFRNLGYDGTYIISWLLKNGYKHTLKDTDSMPAKSFKCIISSVGSHYAYQISNENKQKTTLFDSLKYVNMSIENSAKCYNLPIKKGHIDYDLYRPIDHVPTQEELDYIHNDTEIDMWTIRLNLKEGAVKFTQAGNAKNEFRKLFTKGEWDMLFPPLDNIDDKFIRKSYVGGFVSYNDNFVNKDIFNATSYDINSMYPAQMLHRYMPYGFPVSFEGKYVPSEKYPIYIQRLKCSFACKEDGIPMISSKKAFISKENIYIKYSYDMKRELILSSPDLELFFDNYDVWDIEWLGGVMFTAMKGVEITPEQASTMTVDEVIEQDGQGSYFYDYVKKWRYIKEHEPSGTPARDYAKRMLNALYGAMASNPERKSSVPYLTEDGIVKYNIVDSDSGKTAYLPAGVFITAWSRYFLIKTIKQNKDRFIYCDTDSMYLKNKKNAPNINTHKSLFGFFKLEHKISHIRVVGCKRYIYYGREPKKDNKLHIVCCGADEDIKKQMNFTNFKLGMCFDGKKAVKNVKGGKHIYITTYSLGKPPAV